MGLQVSDPSECDRRLGGNAATNLQRMNLFHVSFLQVKVSLFDKDGGKTDGLALDKSLRNDLEKGTEDTFEYKEIKLGPIVRIEVHKTGSDDWFCEKVTVKVRASGIFRKPLVLQKHISREQKPRIACAGSHFRKK